jgi:hypothetical protein
MRIRSIINLLRKIFFHKKLICSYSVNKSLNPEKNKPTKIAGIVGWINKSSKADLLINNALNDGMNIILIYACIDDPKWYYTNVEPLIKRFPGKIFFAGCVKDKQSIYDQVSDIYVSSNSPAYIYIREECLLTNTNFHEL